MEDFVAHRSSRFCCVQIGVNGLRMVRFHLGGNFGGKIQLRSSILSGFLNLAIFRLLTLT